MVVPSPTAAAHNLLRPECYGMAPALLGVGSRPPPHALTCSSHGRSRSSEFFSEEENFFRIGFTLLLALVILCGPPDDEPP